jgi:hypothetical protein
MRNLFNSVSVVIIQIISGLSLLKMHILPFPGDKNCVRRDKCGSFRTQTGQTDKKPLQEPVQSVQRLKVQFE